MLNTTQKSKPAAATVKPQFNYQDYFKKAGKDFFLKPLIIFDSFHLRMTELTVRMETEFYSSFS